MSSGLVSNGSAGALSSLDDLNSRISACKSCALHESRSRTVPGEGSPTAEIMFIGEGPGQNEDEQGRPFVGRAGKLLDELIAGIPMRREDVFIANMVKCRPPGNRNPEASEITACSSFLDEQLELIDPILIVTLGSVPLTRFAPGKRISAIRGSGLEYQGRWLLPTFHPAYALRNPDALEQMRADFAKIPQALLEGIKLRLAHQSVDTDSDDVVEADSPDDSDMDESVDEADTEPEAESSKPADDTSDANSGQGSFI